MPFKSKKQRTYLQINKPKYTKNGKQNTEEKLGSENYGK